MSNSFVEVDLNCPYGVHVSLLVQRIPTSCSHKGDLPPMYYVNRLMLQCYRRKKKTSSHNQYYESKSFQNVTLNQWRRKREGHGANGPPTFRLMERRDPFNSKTGLETLYLSDLVQYSQPVLGLLRLFPFSIQSGNRRGRVNM